jgi:hypothetical protein
MKQQLSQKFHDHYFDKSLLLGLGFLGNNSSLAKIPFALQYLSLHGDLCQKRTHRNS